MTFCGFRLVCALEALLIGLESNNVSVIEYANEQLLTGPVHLVVCTEAYIFFTLFAFISRLIHT
jgi:hypothetical protein